MLFPSFQGNFFNTMGILHLNQHSCCHNDTTHAPEYARTVRHLFGSSFPMYFRDREIQGSRDRESRRSKEFFLPWIPWPLDHCRTTWKYGIRCRHPVLFAHYTVESFFQPLVKPFKHRPEPDLQILGLSDEMALVREVQKL